MIVPCILLVQWRKAETYQQQQVLKQSTSLLFERLRLGEIWGRFRQERQIDA